MKFKKSYNGDVKRTAVCQSSWFGFIFFHRQPTKKSRIFLLFVVAFFIGIYQRNDQLSYDF